MKARLAWMAVFGLGIVFGTAGCGTSDSSQVANSKQDGPRLAAGDPDQSNGSAGNPGGDIRTKRGPIRPNPLRGPGAQHDDAGAPVNDAGAPVNDAGAPVNDVSPAAPDADQPTQDRKPDGGSAGTKPDSRKSIDAPGAKQGVARLPLFQGWPNPDAVLVLTGQQNGYLEPCGCAGLSVQKGGLARRMSMLEELSNRNWPVTALDVGNQVKRASNKQSDIKFQRTIDGLRAMNYLAIGFGPNDLGRTVGDLIAAASEEPYRFVSANVTVLGLDTSVVPLSRTLKLGGLTIGVTAVLGDEFVRRLMIDEVETRPAEVGLAAAAAELKQENCDWQVLLVYGSLEESRKLAARFPQFRLVVTTGGAEEPAFEPETLAGTETRLVQVGAKGMYAGVVGLYRDGKTRLRYQRVPLDDRFADAPKMLDLLAGYQDQLREAGLEGLEVKESRHPSGRSFVGSEKCGSCHSKAYEKWQDTGHAKATESLVHPAERSEIARHYDPECLSCHVTGWEPQKMFPFKSGYLGLKATPQLVGSGCENCHGPGSAHVAAEEGSGKPAASLVAQLRGEMQLPLKRAHDKCIECHDTDNSPKFHHDNAFDEYWQRIAHPGKD